ESGHPQRLEEKGTALLIALARKTEKSNPTLVWALPVADYTAVLGELNVKGTDAIGEGTIGAGSSLLAGIGTSDPRDKDSPKIKILVAKKNEFALLAPPENREALQHVLSASKSIAGVAQPAHDWLAEQDIFGVCTDKGVKFGLALMLASP